MSNRGLSVPGDSNPPANTRAFVPANAYIGMVDGILQVWCQKGARFTAWEVTRQLRDDNPKLEIVHELVRVAVEHQSASYNYAVVDIADYNGSTARVWGPLPSVIPGQSIPIITVHQDSSGVSTDSVGVVYLLPGVESV